MSNVSGGAAFEQAKPVAFRSQGVRPDAKAERRCNTPAFFFPLCSAGNSLPPAAQEAALLQSENKESFMRVWPGRSYPLGATWDGAGAPVVIDFAAGA